MTSQDKNISKKAPNKGRGKNQTRRIAAGMLAQITRGKTLDEVRDRLEELEPSERNLADAIVQAALRHYGEITYLMARHMKRPLPLRPHIGHALIVIGIAQLRFMDIPAHAALHETVGASGRREQPFRGLINGVLRAVERDDAPSDTRKNLPDWMYARFEAAYGSEKLAAIMATHQALPPLDIGFKNPEKAAAFVASHEAVQLTKTHVRLTRSGHVPALSGFKKGDWFVQDVAASFAAQMLDGLLDGPSDVLDLCSAPGGKTMQLAAMGHNVSALDMSASRLKRLAENLQRTKLAAALITANALDWQTDKTFDGVLLDAPCSASGTLRRHPDLALNRREGYIAKLAETQKALLQRAAQFVKAGGYLGYAVCSLDPDEGENIIADFLTNNPNFKAMAVKNIAADIPAEFTSDMGLRTTPADWADKGGVDGFFTLIMQKTSA